MPIGVMVRFEIFKRDDFRCQYCGRKSPEVVLETDHIVPLAEGGSDDPINLTTACWDCNRGKRDIPLTTVLTGEDPHDRAVLLLERERQLREYNVVLVAERERREEEAWSLWRYWQTEQGLTKKEWLNNAPNADFFWLRQAVAYCPTEQIKSFMDMAIAKRMWNNLKYVAACVRNWRYECQANRDMRDDQELAPPLALQPSSVEVFPPQGKDSPSAIARRKAREAREKP
jgi:hypothetical protein